LPSALLSHLVAILRLALEVRHGAGLSLGKVRDN
jgi:hypothetical protein